MDQAIIFSFSFRLRHEANTSVVMTHLLPWSEIKYRLDGPNTVMHASDQVILPSGLGHTFKFCLYVTSSHHVNSVSKIPFPRTFSHLIFFMFYQELYFEEREEALSFITCVETYYRLCINFYQSLCPRVEPRTVKEMNTVKAHGPVS